MKEHLFYEVVKAQLASRAPGHRGRERARCRRRLARKKLYRQKGTGRARHGSIRAPIYAGGGQAHPPEPRDWCYRPPRQVRIGALKSALSLFVKEGRLIVVDSFELAEIKTKALAGALGTLQTHRRRSSSTTSATRTFELSIRNLEDHQFLPPEGVNVYDLLRHDHLVVSKDAAKALEARCLKASEECPC